MLIMAEEQGSACAAKKSGRAAGKALGNGRGRGRGDGGRGGQNKETKSDAENGQASEQPMNESICWI